MDVLLIWSNLVAGPSVGPLHTDLLGEFLDCLCTHISFSFYGEQSDPMNSSPVPHVTKLSIS